MNPQKSTTPQTIATTEPVVRILYALLLSIWNGFDICIISLWGVPLASSTLSLVASTWSTAPRNNVFGRRCRIFSIVVVPPSFLLFKLAPTSLFEFWTLVAWLPLVPVVSFNRSRMSSFLCQPTRWTHSSLSPVFMHACLVILLWTMNRVPLFKICNTHLFPRVDSLGGLDAQAPPHHRHFSYHRKMKAGDLSNETLRFTVVENGIKSIGSLQNRSAKSLLLPQQHSIRNTVPIIVAGHHHRQTQDEPLVDGQTEAPCCQTARQSHDCHSSNHDKKPSIRF